MSASPAAPIGFANTSDDHISYLTLVRYMDWTCTVRSISARKFLRVLICMLWIVLKPNIRMPTTGRVSCFVFHCCPVRNTTETCTGHVPSATNFPRVLMNIFCVLDYNIHVPSVARVSCYVFHFFPQRNTAETCSVHVWSASNFLWVLLYMFLTVLQRNIHIPCTARTVYACLCLSTVSQNHSLRLSRTLVWYLPGFLYVLPAQFLSIIHTFRTLLTTTHELSGHSPVIVQYSRNLRLCHVLVYQFQSFVHIMALCW
jgi:hypothetical protein